MIKTFAEFWKAGGMKSLKPPGFTEQIAQKAFNAGYAAGLKKGHTILEEAESQASLELAKAQIKSA